LKNYLQMLEEAYEADDYDFKYEYLASCIFDFCTYDSDIDKLFVDRAIEVCRALNTNSTYAYHESQSEDMPWYIIMMNMPFFSSKTDWGTSMRAAWWEHGTIKCRFMGLADEECLVDIEQLEHDEWVKFIDAVIQFYEAGE
jgi:hypothetical protein